jgi:hypothetical protein
MKEAWEMQMEDFKPSSRLQVLHFNDSPCWGPEYGVPKRRGRARQTERRNTARESQASATCTCTR